MTRRARKPAYTFIHDNQEFDLNSTDGQLWNWAQNQVDSVQAFRAVKTRRELVASITPCPIKQCRSSGFVKNKVVARLSQEETDRIYNAEVELSLAVGSRPSESLPGGLEGRLSSYTNFAD